ncbi:MAG: tetratricopeptide repeat protein [Bacillota bacterium]|nr:tetratricopeptide repeat protein [Bacillota bacterium]
MGRGFRRSWARALTGLLLLVYLPVTCAVGPPGVAAAGGAELEKPLLYLQMGLPELALHELEKASAAGGAEAEILVLRGLLLEALGRPERAVETFTAAEQAVSSGSAVLSRPAIKAFLGRAAADRGRVDEAVELYREALSADPSLGLARVGLAEGLSRLGRTEEAIAEYERFLEDNPDDPEALAAVGQLYLVTGRAAEARRALEMAVRLNPGLTEAAEALRRLKEGGGSARPLKGNG